MKRKLIIIGILALILISGVVLLFSFKDKNNNDNNKLSGENPFGSGANISGYDSEGNLVVNQDIESKIFDQNGVPISKIFRVSNSPVAGFVILNINSSDVVRYVERGTGHIIELVLPRGENLAPIELKKITNNTIPKVYKAFFRADGSAALLQTLRKDTDTQENIGINLSRQTSSSTQGTYNITSSTIRGEIGSAAVTSAGRIYYSLTDSGNIVSSDFSGGNSTNHTTLGFDNWELYAAVNSIIIQTKAADGVPGYAYRLSDNGSLTKLLGPLNALLVKPSSLSSRVIYSYEEEGSVRTSIKDLSSGAISEISPITLAKKCAWSSKISSTVFCGAPIKNLLPGDTDAWYKGQLSFSDYIWKYDNLTDISQVIFNPKSELGLDLDVIDPKVSPSDEYLVFINKRDMTLWAQKLTGEE